MVQAHRDARIAVGLPLNSLEKGMDEQEDAPKQEAAPEQEAPDTEMLEVGSWDEEEGEVDRSLFSNSTGLKHCTLLFLPWVR